MRHKKNFNHLSRKKAHRESMLANMVASLIKHKKINTTVAKAKALKRFVEPLITKSKKDTSHSRRMVFQYLQDKNAVTELFREVSQKIADRPGGYTRILKTGNRLGDSAEMCIIELVDYNEALLSVASEKSKAKKTRRRGTKKPKTTETAQTEKDNNVTTEAKTEETPTDETKATDEVIETKDTAKTEKYDATAEAKSETNKSDSSNVENESSKDENDKKE